MCDIQIQTICSIVTTILAFLGLGSYLVGLEKKKFLEARLEIKKNRSAMMRKVVAKFSAQDENISKKNKKMRLKISWSVPLFHTKEWISGKAIELEKVAIDRRADARPKNIYTSRFSMGFSSYSDAIISYDPPSPFNDNLQYRIQGIGSKGIIISEKPHSYFDKINQNARHLIERQIKFIGRKEPYLFSKILKSKDPLGQSIVMPGISTLTLIKSKKKLRVLMHLRHGHTGMTEDSNHVIPAGEFQPSSKYTQAFKDDMNIERNIFRELAEEIGGFPEFDGNSTQAFSYDRKPFKEMKKAIGQGQMNMFYFGFGLDPLTLHGEILTCVVFSEKKFIKIFGKKPKLKNDEGQIITETKKWGCEFTPELVGSYANTNIAPAALALLYLAQEKENFETLKKSVK